MSFAEYRRCRTAGFALNSKLVDKMVGRKDIRRAAGMLGAKFDRKGIELHSDMEVDALMDFILCDLRDGRGRSKVQAYLEDVGPATDFERELLDMRIHSRSSLFRAKACNPRRRTVDLSDQLHGGRRDIVIHDRGLSASLTVDNSIFCRIYSRAGLHMTSGIGFNFPGEIAPGLIRMYKAMRAESNHRGPASRFALFFRLNRMHGLTVHPI